MKGCDMRAIIKDKKGSAVVKAVAVIFAMTFIFSIVFQYARVLIITFGIREAVRNELIMIVNSNYSTSFYGMCEGNTGAYGFDNGWHDISCLGDAENDIVSMLGLQKSGGAYEKTESGGKPEYSIKDINVTITNADFASNSVKFRAHVSYTLSIPVTVFLIDVQTFTFTKTANVRFEQKF
jgi:hypothetical protein